ncbi:hypothetical protein L3Q82_005613 [Scortum barcoo]|uniref:Uncharacterized protein n=1 Tax=Scortum barcoo TaxID=214431 RepID=A0ACB8V6M2_9TELE|nr:hypothetical protein L3Q82_005613 [Scortum barcoo]
MSLGWPGNASDPPGRAGGSVWGEGGLGISAQTAASATRSRTKRMKMDGWMDGSAYHNITETISHLHQANRSPDNGTIIVRETCQTAIRSSGRSFSPQSLIAVIADIVILDSPAGGADDPNYRAASVWLQPSRRRDERHREQVVFIPSAVNKAPAEVKGPSRALRHLIPSVAAEEQEGEGGGPVVRVVSEGPTGHLQGPNASPHPHALPLKRLLFTETLCHFTCKCQKEKNVRSDSQFANPPIFTAVPTFITAVYVCSQCVLYIVCVQYSCYMCVCVLYVVYVVCSVLSVCVVYVVYVVVCSICCVCVYVYVGVFSLYVVCVYMCVFCVHVVYVGVFSVICCVYMLLCVFSVLYVVYVVCVVYAVYMLCVFSYMLYMLCVCSMYVCGVCDVVYVVCVVYADSSICTDHKLPQAFCYIIIITAIIIVTAVISISSCQRQRRAAS